MPRTVGRHIEHILSKLNVHSRSQAIAFAYRHGLFSPARGAGAHLEREGVSRPDSDAEDDPPRAGSRIAVRSSRPS
jgi:hypothetical protein